MSVINKSKYIAELTKLLGFMSSWDRDATLEKYSAMFDGTQDEEALLEELGTPTRVAIELAREYVPSPPPVIPAVEKPESPEAGEAASDAESNSASADAPAEEAPVRSAETVSSPEVTEKETGAGDEPAQDKVAREEKKARPVVMTLWIIVSVVIGLPVAIVLIALGLPFLAAGAAAVYGAISGAVEILPRLALFSDRLLTIGGGCILAAAGAVVAWFGIWLSLSLGWVWIGKLLFGMGSKLCYKKGGDDNG